MRQVTAAWLCHWNTPRLSERETSFTARSVNDCRPTNQDVPANQALIRVRTKDDGLGWDTSAGYGNTSPDCRFALSGRSCIGLIVWVYLLLDRTKLQRHRLEVFVICLVVPPPGRSIPIGKLTNPAIRVEPGRKREIHRRKDSRRRQYRAGGRNDFARVTFAMPTLEGARVTILTW